MALIKNKKLICIDLGTSKMVIYISGVGIVYNESTKIAYDTRTNEPICIGKDADALDGKTSAQIRIEYPIVEGVIHSMSAADDMMHLVAKKLERPNMWNNAIVLLACPSSVTELEKHTLRKIALDLGASQAIVKEAIQMAAIGAGLDFFAPKGNLIIDIGSGSSDVAVVSAGDAVISHSIRLSGDSLNREIMLHIRTKYNMLIGSIFINLVKHKLGCLKDYDPPKFLNIFGRDAISGLPKEIQLTSTEIMQVFKLQFVSITDLLVDILEKTPPNLMQDVIQNGMTVVGGMAHLRGIRDFIEKIFKFKVNLIQEPELAVIHGAIKLEKDLPKLIQDAKIERKNEYHIK